MTTHTYESAPPEIQSAAPRRVLLSPFGWYTRYTLRSYGRHVFVVIVALLCIALSIDLSQRAGQLLSMSPGASSIESFGRLAWYAVLRGTDLSTQLLPLACFLGVLWHETTQTLSRERVMIWNSGRSPLQCLIPALILGLLAGGTQLFLEMYARPAAIKAQADGRLGDYGRMFNRALTNSRQWIAASRDLVHARIEYGPPPTLHDVMIYRHSDEGELEEVITARTATPGAGANRGVLHGGGRWTVAEARASQDAQAPPPAEGAAPGVQTFVIELKVDPLWLSNFRIYARFLPQDVLRSLANEAGGRYATADYRTWLQFRNAQALYPGSMGLLAVSLSLLLMAHGVSIAAVVGMAFAGYVGHIAVKACLLLGEHGYLSPTVAAWFAPTALISVSIVALTIARWRSLGGPRSRVQTS
jgi:lipopolysaccharide export LptBFGC system permease protein LptF